MANQTDVDINVLIQIYNAKLAQLSNQNVLLEAKVQTLTQDFLDEKNDLLASLKELQEKHDTLLEELEDDETSK
tara:strand:- start:1222 stop:1443 length:222 start_codon:yes stop_codon:yes gene_type:complete